VSSDQRAKIDAKLLLNIWDCSDTSYALDHRRAQIVAAIGFVFNVTMMIAAALVAVAINSSMMFVLSSQHLLDALGDILVLWRFWCEPTDPNNEKYDLQGSVMISFCAMSSTLYVATFTVKKIIHQEHPHFVIYAVILSTVICLGAAVLAYFKIQLAKESRLNSQTLHLDGITSLFVSVLAFVYIICVNVYDDFPETWWSEHAVALTLSILLFLYALRNLLMTKHGDEWWYTKEFWTYRDSRGNETPRGVRAD